MTAPFWKTKSLSEMSDDEWESLCDGCGKCCLHKLQDEDTGRVHLTVVACRLLDLDTARCTNYPDRRRFVPACVRIAPDNVTSLALPSTCAYRRLAEGLDLPPWHPLVTGDPKSTLEARRSIRGWAVSEIGIEEEDLEDYVIAWAQEEPRRK